MNILFTSVGRRTYLVRYFKEALGGDGKVFAANSSADSPAFLAADESVVTPIIYDDAYIPFLLDYCKEKKIDALISLFDVDLPVLARNKQAFAEIGVKVVVSDPETVDICNDKWTMFCFLKDCGFRVPQTFLHPEEALRAVKDGTLQFPLFVKPRWGMGSIAMYQADSEEELRIFYEKTKRGIAASYLKYEARKNPEECVLIQEKLPGQEHGLDIINDLNGNYMHTVCKKKAAMRAGETDCAVTVDSPVLRELGERLSRVMKHIGNMDCDVFMVDGAPYVLEMNARFGGGYPFSHMAGVDLPRAIVGWLSGENVDPSLLQEEYGVAAQKDIELVILSR